MLAASVLACPHDSLQRSPGNQRESCGCCLQQSRVIQPLRQCFTRLSCRPLYGSLTGGVNACVQHTARCNRPISVPCPCCAILARPLRSKKQVVSGASGTHSLVLNVDIILPHMHFLTLLPQRAQQLVALKSAQVPAHAQVRPAAAARGAGGTGCGRGVHASAHWLDPRSYLLLSTALGGWNFLQNVMGVA